MSDGPMVWIDEAASFAETGELQPVDDAVPLDACALTDIELDLFPEGLHGTVIAVKVEWYRKGRDDQRQRTLAALPERGVRMSARQGGKSAALAVAARVAQSIGLVPAEEDPEGSR
jgi:hypothetical protein